MYEDIFDIIEKSILRTLKETRRLLERVRIPLERELIEPLMDIRDEGDYYVIELDLPGVRKEDIQLYVSPEGIEIRAVRKGVKEEKKEGWIKRERIYIGYQRFIPLPPDADPEKIDAEYRDGVLIIRIGKKEGAKRKRIPIR